MQNHNEYLVQIESYLSDIPVMAKIKILEEIDSSINSKEVSDLVNPLVFANEKRAEHGFVKYEKEKKFSIWKFLVKSFAIFSILSITGITILFWKFTPLLKIDEENNKVIILGGLIDIDGKAGKVKILDEVQFNQDHYNNDFQANIELDSEKDEVIGEFKVGTFKLENSPSSELNLNCKLSSQLTKNIIIQEDDLIKFDLRDVEGANCTLKIPEDKKITLNGIEANIFISKPEFNSYIDIKSGKVSIEPEREIDYKYILDVKDGYVGEFVSSDFEEAYEVQVSIESGSIISK